MHDKNIWITAPEDATHYLPEQPHLDWVECWYKKIGNDWWSVPCSTSARIGYMGWLVDDEDIDVFEPLLIRRPISFKPEDSVEVRCNGWSDWQIGTLKYKSDCSARRWRADLRSVPIWI